MKDVHRLLGRCSLCADMLLLVWRGMVSGAVSVVSQRGVAGVRSCRHVQQAECAKVARVIREGVRSRR